MLRNVTSSCLYAANDVQQNAKVTLHPAKAKARIGSFPFLPD